MMFKLFVALTLSLVSYSQASVKTATHVYIVSENDGAVLAIDRIGNEKIIRVGERPQSMVLFMDRGYVANKGSNTVSVIDLQTNEVTSTIAVGDHPNAMVVYNSLGYVVNMFSRSVSVINLETNKVIQSISVGYMSYSMVVHGDFGYVVNSESSTVSVIDLKANIFVKDIYVGCKSHPMVIHENIGYVVNEVSSDVSVISLERNELIQTIKLEPNPGQMVVVGDLGYVRSLKTGNVHALRLKNIKVTQMPGANGRTKPRALYLKTDDAILGSTYPYGCVTVLDFQTLEGLVVLCSDGPLVSYLMDSCDPMIVREGLGFVKSQRANTLTIIDLVSDCILSQVSLPTNRNIDFSDTHIYGGLQKLQPIVSRSDINAQIQQNF